MKRCALAACIMLVGSGALAQPEKSTESVTVTGTHDRQVLEKFVEGLAAPSRMTGKMARWEDGVCPATIGLAPRFAAYVTQRVRDVARQAGAPVNGKSGCKPNIHIVFTTAPQALIDNIKKKQPEFLGYFDNQRQLDKLAAVSRPIQAWYTTATRDLRGNVQVDGAKTAGPGMDITYPCLPPQEGICTLHLSNAHAGSVTGSRLGDGMRATLYKVVIAADPTKLLDHEIGSLADYIALLSLTQLSSPDDCQPLASIVNLLAKDCAPVKALTDNDRAYLKGLYRMGADRIVGVQRAQIAYDMQQNLEGK